jgi:hypothetical protein
VAISNEKWPLCLRTYIRFRSTRSGNRQLNKAIHRIAVTQLRQRGLGRVYYEKRIAQGDTAKHALRCLKRRLSRVVFNRLRDDERSRLAWTVPHNG